MSHIKQPQSNANNNRIIADYFILFFDSVRTTRSPSTFINRKLQIRELHCVRATQKCLENIQTWKNVCITRTLLFTILTVATKYEEIKKYLNKAYFTHM